MRDTHIRSPLLSSKTIRSRLAHRADNPTFEAIFASIDKLSAMHDALYELHVNRDPLQTREANSLKLLENFKKASAKADIMSKVLVDEIAKFQTGVERTALETAGIARDSAYGVEIRAALRAMPQGERDAAVQAAFDQGDAHTVAALAHSPTSLLTGSTKLPVKELTRMYLHRACPSLERDLADADAAIEAFALAAEGFCKSTGELRDKACESRALEGKTKADSAQAGWQALMG